MEAGAGARAAGLLLDHWLEPSLLLLALLLVLLLLV